MESSQSGLMGEFEKGNVAAIVDRRLADQVVDMEEVTRAVQVSFWCIQEHPSRRPTMGKVVQMLEGIVEIGMPPPLKALTGESGCGTGASLALNSTSLFIFIFIISNRSHTAFHFRENYGEAIFIVVTTISNQISLAFMVFTSPFFVQPACN
ncbi:hypothetical protein OIU85_003178 [Salix viminalis]|uniref:Serine-threonine/tyrosine-protein kinase catalytic domain-containing protein n=1 Tax=Salix viminalis TaxID=40686 RepID=A0A9Q0T0E7_SALVM|nr:hypothetical protein OIU85_003178 [Salix viminalis]